MNPAFRFSGLNSSVMALAFALICSPVLAQSNPPVQNPPSVAENDKVEIQVPRHRGIIGEGYPEKVTYTPTCPKFVFDISASMVQESTDRAFVEAEIARLPQLEQKWDDYILCLKTNFELDRDIIKNNVNASLAAYINADKVYGDDVYNAVDAAWQVVLKNEKAKKQITEEAYVSNWKAPEGTFKGYFSGTKPEDVKYVSTCPVYQAEVTAQIISGVQTRARLLQIIDVIKTESTRRKAYAECRQSQAIEDFMALQKSMVNHFTDNIWNPESESYRKKVEVFNNVVAGLKLPGGILGPKVAPAKPAPVKPSSKTTKTKKKN